MDLSDAALTRLLAIDDKRKVAGLSTAEAMELMKFGGKMGDMAREVLRLRASEQRAQVVLDGCDYREGHLRDNADVDKLRDVVRGLADELAELHGAVDRIKAAVKQPYGLAQMVALLEAVEALP